MLEELMSAITEADLPNEDMRLIAERCGLDVAVKILQELPGVAFFVPKNGFQKVLTAYIRHSYNGTNAKVLALATGMTERYVYEVVRQGHQTEIEEMQLPLFPGGVE
jgi:Mor family transcriptional regulator